MMRKLGVGCLAGAMLMHLAGLANALTAVQRGKTTVVAMSGDAAPGGGVFEFFFEPVLNNAGDLAFAARIDASDSGSGIFQGDAGGLTAIAREGTAPRVGNFFSFQLPALNDAGQVAFAASLLTASPLQVNVYGHTGGANVRIAGVGDTAPGGGVIQHIGLAPQINELGQLAFPVSFNAATGATGGIYRGSGGALTQISRVGQPAPGGGAYSGYYYAMPLNDLGQVAWAATLSGAPAGEGSGIYRGDGMTTVAIAREGQSAPGGIGTFRTLEFSGPALSDSGVMAFIANVDVGGGQSVQGLFRGTGGPLSTIAKSGDPVAGGGEHGGFAYGPVINDSGEVAFAGFVRDMPGGIVFEGALFVGDENGLTEIIRQGDAAPDGNGAVEDFSAPELNNAGQVAFMVDYGGTSGGSMDELALFLFTPGTGLALVAREGDPLLGSTITNLSFSSHLSHVASIGDEESGLNDAGQVAFSFQLADGRRGVAVWAVPEPGSAALGVMGAMVGGLVCRRSGRLRFRLG